MLKLVHELVVEIGVLQDSLSYQGKVGIRGKGSEGVSACRHVTGIC
jgi:hypothetical protein